MIDDRAIRSAGRLCLVHHDDHTGHGVDVKRPELGWRRADEIDPKFLLDFRISRIQMEMSHADAQVVWSGQLRERGWGEKRGSENKRRNFVHELFPQGTAKGIIR